ncbi:MAG: PD-(D/E)XK nuclease family protein [Terrimicrobiaceae bacterium]
MPSSQLSRPISWATYVRCPACYYRRYILGEKAESQAMLLGTLFHNAAASFYKAKRLPAADNLFARLRARFPSDSGAAEQEDAPSADPEIQIRMEANPASENGNSADGSV